MDPDDTSKSRETFRRVIGVLTVRLVAAYLVRNVIPPSGLPSLLTSIHEALMALVPPADVTPAPERPTSAEIRQSVQQDTIISFIDGRPYKTLKRHLTAHGLTPDRYRARYGLPNDYPMAAPGYVARRSEIAREIQFGSKTA